MSGGSAQQKTEAPSPKKLKDARQKGQVPKSKDLGAAMILLFALLLILFLKENILISMQRELGDYFSTAIAVDLPAQNLPFYALGFLSRMTMIMLPVFGGIMLVAIFANLMQVGVMFSPQVLQPKLERLNPVEGFKRIFSMRSLFELAKNILKITIVAAATYMVAKKLLHQLLPVYFKTPAQLLDAIAEAMMLVALVGGFAFFVIAIFDLMFQRYEHIKNLRMTKQEVKDEYKQTEGDPMVKSWLRRRQREMLVNAVRREVPQATVVVTNPTHVAVAIKYDENKNSAPVVTAKGAGDLAAAIKRIAKNHKVPVVENPPVARALYQIEIGAEIPAELYQAMAEVIAAVYRLQKKGL